MPVVSRRGQAPRVAALVLVLVGAAFAGTVACAGELEDPNRFTTRPPAPGTASGGTDGGGSGGATASAFDCSDPTTAGPELLADSCGGSICHGGSDPAAALDLESSGVGMRLVDAPATECDGKVLVQGGDGYLLEKVEDDNPTCGDPMPIGIPLSDDELACLKDWVATL